MACVMGFVSISVPASSLTLSRSGRLSRASASVTRLIRSLLLQAGRVQERRDTLLGLAVLTVLSARTIRLPDVLSHGSLPPRPDDDGS